MKKQKILYYNVDDTLDYEKSLLEQWGITEVELAEVHDKSGQKSFVEYAAGADGIVVEYEQLTAAVLEQLPCCKIVSLQSIGYNNVDVEAAARLGICVTNIPGFCTEEVALHAVGMLIDLARKITYYDRSVRNGSWDPLLGPPIHRISGKTIGLVFFGSIPKAMLPMLKALGLNILVYAPTKTAEYLAQYGAQKAQSLEELLQVSDIVSLHCPLMDSTRHLIGKRELAMMKPDAFLINTARGAVVDEKALVHALKSGVIAAAAVDVIEDEENETSELFELENTVITPHAAFLSVDSYEQGRRMALEQLLQRLVEKRLPDHLVNRTLIENLKG
ncbi:MAG: C-terminal binding protein [Oscillospiraceae bacterium]|nr:C-terminal binding protein [Oscillospiraceae bacterium]